MRPMTRMLAILLLGGFWCSAPSDSATRNPQQDKRIAAAKELEPAVIEFFNTKVKETILASAPKPFVSLTVATKRYDSSYALVALSVDTNDPALLGNVPDLNLNIQPVLFFDPTTKTNLGNSTSGVLKAPGATSNESSLYNMSFPASAVSEANAIVVEATLSTTPRPLVIVFTISLDNELKLGATGRGSPTARASIKQSGLILLRYLY